MVYSLTLSYFEKITFALLLSLYTFQYPHNKHFFVVHSIKSLTSLNGIPKNNPSSWGQLYFSYLVFNVSIFSSTQAFLGYPILNKNSLCDFSFKSFSNNNSS